MRVILLKRKRPGLPPRPLSTTTKLSLKVSSTVRLAGRAQHPVKGEWSRRRAAAQRLPAFGFCPCSDPWSCSCRRPVVESENQTDAWALALRHLIEVGLRPLAPVGALRSLWHRGGEDRELAITVHVDVEDRP